MNIPEKIIIDITTPLIIVWHIFIDEKGYIRGKNIIQRQFLKIKNSGLLDRCESINIGFVSTLDFPCETIKNHPKVKFV